MEILLGCVARGGQGSKKGVLGPWREEDWALWKKRRCTRQGPMMAEHGRGGYVRLIVGVMG